MSELWSYTKYSSLSPSVSAVILTAGAFLQLFCVRVVCQSALVNGVVRSRGVLITAYSTALIHQDLLLSRDWHYVILDEGHKIRNPDAQITLVCKQVWSSLPLLSERVSNILHATRNEHFPELYELADHQVISKEILRMFLLFFGDLVFFDMIMHWRQDHITSLTHFVICCEGELLHRFFS